MGDITIPSEEKGWFVMKALSVYRLTLVVGLVLGLMVVLAAGIPSVISEDTLVGGQPGEIVDGCSCTGTQTGAQCGNDCGGGTYVACLTGEAPEGEECYTPNPVESCLDTPDCTTGDAACGFPP